jgi:hypothetical protein
MCAGFNNPLFRPTAYSYRILEYLLRRSPKLKPKDLVAFALDYYYRSEDVKSQVFLMEALKIWKDPRIPEVYDDGSRPECYKYITETYEQIKVYVDREDKLKRFFDGILPRSISTQITVDFLYSFEDSTDVPPSTTVQSSSLSTKLSKSTVLSKLTEIIQRAPIPTKSEYNEKVLFSHLDMLISKKRILEKEYSLKINTLKRLKIITELNVYLSSQTEI